MMNKLKTVWIVNMGIGEDVKQRVAMRVFAKKEHAIQWVKEHFEGQIKELQNVNALTRLHIGNSFYIYPMEITKKEDSEVALDETI